MQKADICLLGLIFTLLFACPSIHKAQETNPLDRLHQEYLQALRLIGDQQYDKTIKILERIINEDDTFYRAYIKTMAAYKEKNALDEARQYFEDLIAKNPKNPYAHHGLGLVYQEQRNIQQAIEKYRKSIELDNTRAAIYRDIVDAYKETKNLQGAIDYLSGQAHAKAQNDGAYYGLGYAYVLLRQWENALMNLDKALNLNTNLLIAYLEKANIYYYWGKFQEGLQVNMTGYEIAKRTTDIEFQHMFLGSRGKFLVKLGKHQEALECYQEALAIARDIGDRGNEGKYLGNMGVIYGNIAEYSKALDYYSQAIKIAREVGDKTAEVAWLNNMGFIYRNLGQFESALTLHKRALKIAREIEDKKWESLNIGNIGTVYLYLGKYSQALTHYEQALAIDREIEVKTHQGTWLTNIGLCYWHLSNYRKALAYYEQALVILRDIGDKSEEGRTLGAIGRVYWKMGDYSKALEYNEKALTIAKEIGNRGGESRNLANLGNVYNELGKYNKALEYYKQAESIAQQIGDKSQQGAWLGNIGVVYHELSNYSKALEYYEQSLKINREIGNKKDEGLFLGNIGLVYVEAGNYSEALKSYKQGLKIAREIGDKSNEGYQLNNLGSLDLKLKIYSKSATHYQKALAIGQEIEEPIIIWEAHTGLATAYEMQGNYAKSLHQYRLAVQEIESVRSLLQLEEQKASFLERKINAYEKLINLLATLHQKKPSKGYDREALQYAEGAKARALLDMVYQGRIFHNLAEIPADCRQKFLVNEKELEKKHLDLSAELGKEVDKRDKDLVLALNNEIEALQREKAQLLEEIKEKYPRFYRLTNPKILRAEEVQRDILNDNQVLVEYLVGDERIFVWILTKHRLNFGAIDLTRKELAAKLARISPLFKKDKAISDVKIDHRWANIQPQLLRELYQILLEKPAAEFLKSDVELIIIPDDILYYFPFEILVTELTEDRVCYLVESHPISYTSSASLLNPELLKPRKPRQDLLAFGNPDFGAEQDRGIIEWASSLVPFKSILRGNRFESLPKAEIEVEEIARHFDNPVVFIGREASEERFKQMADDFRFIHLATHNLTDDKQPMYSKIILSQTDKEIEDGYLQTYEVYNLRLNADMVVLSGCNTGLGPLSRGEGIIGMTRAFLYAGVPSLVVSLWPVDDESTALLMKSFYKYLRFGLNKTQALQKAKMDLSKSDDWKRDPFYWGPFVLIGDWSEVKMK